MFRYQIPSAGALALALSLALASGAPAQGVSAQTAVTLNATFDEALTISATPGVVNFDLLNSLAAGDAPITVEVRATVSQQRASLILELYFANRATALTNNAAAIPSDWVYSDLQLGAGGSKFACVFVTTASPDGGSCGEFDFTFDADLDGFPVHSGLVATRVVNLLIQPQGSLVAGTYDGTLFVQVTAL